MSLSISRKFVEILNNAMLKTVLKHSTFFIEDALIVEIVSTLVIMISLINLLSLGNRILRVPKKASIEKKINYFCALNPH